MTQIKVEHICIFKMCERYVSEEIPRSNCPCCQCDLFRKNCILCDVRPVCTCRMPLVTLYFYYIFFWFENFLAELFCCGM